MASVKATPASRLTRDKPREGMARAYYGSWATEPQAKKPVRQQTLEPGRTQNGPPPEGDGPCRQIESYRRNPSRSMSER